MKSPSAKQRVIEITDFGMGPRDEVRGRVLIVGTKAEEGPR